MHNLKNCFLAPALILSGLCVAQPDIDLVYGTFLGASGDETSFANTLDKSADGHLGFMGSTSSPFMSTTPDAYQGQLQGLLNRFIVILDPEGAPVYRSYFGGGGETGGGFAFTENGGFVIGGFTSSASFPTTPGAHQTEFLEGEPGEPPARMGTLSKFDENYQLEWSTYVGGVKQDVLSDVEVDPEGNVYAVGSTYSSELGTDGAFQEELYDNETFGGFLSKYSPSGEQLYFTYFQGNAPSQIGSCKLSENGEKLFVLGATWATEGIAFGGIQDENAGAGDAFVACFESATGQLLWSRYVGGEDIDGIIGMDLSENGHIVLHLLSYSTTGLATEGAHLESPLNVSGVIGSDYNRVIVVLDEDGQTIWGSYFDLALFAMGTHGALAVNSNELIITGYTNSDAGVAIGAPFEDELQPDFGQMIAKFDLETGAQIWGTYFGLEGKASIYNMTYIDDGRFMAVGTGRNPNGYITDDAYQSVFGGGARDFYYAIFEENTLSTHETALQPLELYPNPTGHAVRVTAPGNLFGTVALQVYDLSGRMVLQQAAFHSGTELRVGHLPAGIYVVHVQDRENQYRQKLVVAK